MVLEELVWKTRPGACELEPPVAGSGPWSTTVTSVQPRAETSSARAAPTTPAPMITTRGPAIAAPPKSKPGSCSGSCFVRNAIQVAQLNVPVARRGCQEVRDVGERPEGGGETPGKRQCPAGGADGGGPPPGRGGPGPPPGSFSPASPLGLFGPAPFFGPPARVIFVPPA